jgi:hypothetical protein
MIEQCVNTSMISLDRTNIITNNITEQCVICLENMESTDNNNPLLTLECSHIFHKKCIDDWLNRTQTCPMCRKKVEPDNTIRDLTINRFIQKLKFVQLVALTDIITSISLTCSNYINYYNGILDFVCALWGYWGVYKLNINYLILYCISRTFTVGIIGYKIVVYVYDDTKRIYDTITTVYSLLCILYIYVIYTIITLIINMNKYREDVIPMMSF